MGAVIVTVLFKVYVEYITQDPSLDESQAGMKTAGRNINNLKYADNTTLMAESKEELKSLLMRFERAEIKSWLESQHSKIKIKASGPINSWQIGGGKVVAVANIIFLDCKITGDGDCSHEIKRHFLLGR